MQVPKKTIIVSGVEIDVFSGAYLAKRIHRRPSILKKWEWLGWIPKPIFKTADGRRWYTQEEIDVYVMIVEEEQVRAGSCVKKTKFVERIFCEISLVRKKLEEEIANATII